MRGSSLVVVAFVAAIFAASIPAQAAGLQQDAKLTQGPPIRDAVSPYDGALQCLATQLTPQQKATSFSVGQFADRSGKVNYVADSGTGSFSSQGLEEMIMTSLFRAGVVTTDFSSSFRQSTDWALGKMMQGGGNARISLIYPDVIISGGITSFDFMPGGGASLNIAGIQLARNQSRILVAMDARAVLMIGSKIPGPGGKVMAVDRSTKQIVGYEESAGGTGFFGPRNSPTFVSLDFGRRPNEAMQLAQRYMIDRLVFKLVAQTFANTACDAQLEYGDTVSQLVKRD